MFERIVRQVIAAGRTHKWLLPLGVLALLALFGGAAYAAVVLITSLFVPGDTGISRHLLMLGGGLALSAGGGSLLLVRRPRSGKSNARKKFLRARK